MAEKGNFTELSMDMVNSLLSEKNVFANNFLKTFSHESQLRGIKKGVIKDESFNIIEQ